MICVINAVKRRIQPQQAIFITKITQKVTCAGSGQLRSVKVTAKDKTTTIIFIYETLRYTNMETMLPMDLTGQGDITSLTQHVRPLPGLSPSLVRPSGTVSRTLSAIRTPPKLLSGACMSKIFLFARH